MLKVVEDSYSTILKKHKIREENGFYTIYFPETGEYFAANEVGIDIILFFFQSEYEELISYLENMYGQLNLEQRKAVISYVERLCSMHIIEKGISNEEI